MQAPTTRRSKRRLLQLDGPDRELAFSHLVEHAMYTINDILRHPRVFECAEASRAADRLRTQLVVLIHVLPVCTKAFLAKARELPCFEAMLAYERTRCGMTCSSFFLDGIPRSVEIFDPPPRWVIQEANLKKIKLRDAMKDRHLTIEKLENDLIPTVAGLYPRPVNLWVKRARAVAVGLKWVKPASHCVACANQNCKREFYVGSPNEMWANAPLKQAEDDEDDCSDEEENSSEAYWRTASCASAAVEPSPRRFCSRACCHEFDAHLKRIMPVTPEELEPDDNCAKFGRTRVATAFDMALKRNEVAARKLRIVNSGGLPPNLAIAKPELEERIEKCVCSLNVDLGVLHAAATVAESAQLSKNRLLPGSKIYWRHDPLFFVRVLTEVTRIYQKAKRKEGIVSSLLTKPRFLEKIELQASRMV